MTSTTEVAAYLDTLLETAAVPDYANAVNGLQLFNRGQVRKIVACVDFSTKAVSRAIEESADLLLVHHGMFWSGVKPIAGTAYTRMRMLFDNDIAVYASHLPLDRHPLFGNNTLLSQQLGLIPSGEFARYKGTTIGVCGTCHISTAELVDRARRFARVHGGDVVATGFADNRQTSRWAICTGAGASAETLEEAARSGIDTLIVGEGPHWTAVEAAESGLVIVYAGHYATETLGVAAIAEHVAEHFGLKWAMIHAPTGL